MGHAFFWSAGVPGPQAAQNRAPAATGASQWEQLSTAGLSHVASGIVALVIVG